MNKKINKKNNSMKPLPPKKKTIDRNQLLAYLLAVLIIFWTVASVFGLIAYVRTKKSNSANLITASAQTVEDFEDNHRLIITNPIKNFVVYETRDNVITSSMSTLFGYDFYFGDFDVGLFDGNEHSFYEEANQYLYYAYLLSNANDTDLEQFEVGLSFLDMVDFDEPWTSIDYSITGTRLIQNNTVVLYFYHTFVFTDSVQGYSETIHFSFRYNLYSFPVDADLTVLFPNAPAGMHEWKVSALDYESSPTANGFDTTDFLLYYYTVDQASFDVAYGGGYDKGYEEGLADAPAIYYNEGYREGRDTGRKEGEAIGYQKGLDARTLYSFDGLLSAVFDVPVRTFFSFFSFEILGIDFSSFFLSLFAVSVFLAVVKFIL